MSLPYLQPYLGLSNGLNTLHGGAAAGVGGWVELGRTTLGSAGDNIDVTSLPDKRYYMYLLHRDTSGSTSSQMTFNNDSGSNYSIRYAQDGTEYTATSQSYVTQHTSATQDSFTCGYIANYASKEKLISSWIVGDGGAGATNAPGRYEQFWKWTNTSSAINRIDIFNHLTGDFDTGSELVVLGYDPTDTHTNNFWEELASVSGTGSSTSLDTSTFTAKKYLWIQAFIDAPTSVDAEISVGNGTIDSGSNYSYRASNNGGTDSTTTSASYIALDSGSPTVPSFMNIFVINNASNEKLFIAHQVDGNTASAATAPDRRETVGKWANTSSQINRIQIYNNTATNFTTSSIMKVWGAD